jgi:hypothetical protein
VDWVHGAWIGGTPGSTVDQSDASIEAAVAPAHSTPGAGARQRGRRGRAGQGEAGGWLIGVEPTVERRHDEAGDRGGGGFAEVAVQALGRREKREGRCGKRR